MLTDLIEKLEKEGRIRKQKVGLIQIESLLREAILDLKEAKKILHLAERATYLLAYNAMIKGGRAILLLKGYVPGDRAQHKTLVEMTSAILGNKYVNLSRQFERMRRKRNEMTYEAGTSVSESEVQKAFSDAISLIQKIIDEVKLFNPQLELKFDLDGE